MIYHITTENAWQLAQEDQQYSPESLKTEGFIHFSDHFQIEGTANRFYSLTPDLIVLEVDPDKLAAPLVYENLEGGEMLFPHVYGTLNLDAVVSTFKFDYAKDGRILLPEGQKHPEPELLTEFPFGTPGRVFRSPTPGSRMFDVNDQVMDLYLENKIDTVVVLNDEAEHIRHTGKSLLDRYEKAGLCTISAPVPDFSAPPLGHWDQTVKEAVQAVKSGQNLAVHCHAGIGRTGMFVALMASELLDLDAEHAIAWVRTYVPYAIDTHNQKTFVREEIEKRRPS